MHIEIETREGDQRCGAERCDAKPAVRAKEDNRRRKRGTCMPGGEGELGWRRDEQSNAGDLLERTQSFDMRFDAEIDAEQRQNQRAEQRKAIRAEPAGKKQQNAGENPDQAGVSETGKKDKEPVQGPAGEMRGDPIQNRKIERSERSQTITSYLRFCTEHAELRAPQKDL